MTSYQFGKYKNFPFTMENIINIFYKKENNSQINSLKYFKENGYITGQVSDICDKNMNNKNIINWDHENFVMSCDPNYFNKKEFTVYERCLYGKAEAEIQKKSFEEGLDLLHTLREEGAVDAQRYWETGVELTLSAARESMGDFRETGSIEGIPVIAGAFTALQKYDADQDNEFNDIYKELLAGAAAEREAQHWDKASKIYDALQKAGAGDSDELLSLKQETVYEEAEAAFAEKNYNKSSQKYGELGNQGEYLSQGGEGGRKRKLSGCSDKF